MSYYDILFHRGGGFRNSKEEHVSDDHAIVIGKTGLVLGFF
jgi:hypothetical protein